MTTMDKTKAKRMKQGSAEWHAERSKGIGGSDMAAVMGLNPWKTPYVVVQQGGISSCQAAAGNLRYQFVIYAAADSFTDVDLLRFQIGRASCRERVCLYV